MLSRQAGFVAAGCDVVSSPGQALEIAGDVEEVMVIGGGNVYEQFLPMTDRIYLTRVDAHIDGDTWFPALDPGEWQVVESEAFPTGDDRTYGFVLETWERNRG